jgi:succinoglycan biosynthesis protein ExoA
MQDIQTSMAAFTGAPSVTIVVPALNEEAHIEACVESLVDQFYPGLIEIMVLDGGSTDATRAIVQRLARQHGIVRLIHNPGRLQSAACNLAARLAAPWSTVLVRADAHAVYQRHFVAACALSLQEKGATSVVVPMRTVGDKGLQRAVAAVQNSVLGNGGSAHRQAGRSGFVEHGHHAAFDLAFFRSVGGYDETFTHNEDAELDVRMAAAGGRIWMCGEATIDYIPRSRISALARQYFNHGKGRARTLLTHGLRPKPRQMLPLAMLFGCVGGLVAAPFWAPAALVPAGYAAACTAVGLVAALRARSLPFLAMGPVAMVMHLSWAVGVLHTALTWRSAGSGITERADERAVATLI